MLVWNKPNICNRYLQSPTPDLKAVDWGGLEESRPAHCAGGGVNNSAEPAADKLLAARRATHRDIASSAVALPNKNRHRLR
jgi:hypothetical protein